VEAAFPDTLADAPVLAYFVTLLAALDANIDANVDALVDALFMFFLISLSLPS